MRLLQMSRRLEKQLRRGPSALGSFLRLVLPCAALRVLDLGPGIARQNLPRLSERFYRVDGQKSGARSGTGLGLAIVKHIMNRHKGGLAVESAVGEGAVFTVFFPITGLAGSAD